MVVLKLKYRRGSLQAVYEKQSHARARRARPPLAPSLRELPEDEQQTLIGLRDF